ncbi:MAG: acyltransferase [Kiritimatiellia bacterium]
MNREISKNIDELRGLSSLVVVLSHTFQWFILPMTGLDHIAREISSSAAHVAVITFFVLSGYVITNSLAANHSANGRINPAAYIKSRLTRILPAGLFGVAISLIVLIAIIKFNMHGRSTFRTGTELYVARESLNFSLKDLLSCAIFSNGIIPGTGPISTNGPLWSLSIEFWIYFIALLSALALGAGTLASDKDVRYPCIIGLIMIFIPLAPRPEILEYFVYWAAGSIVFAGSGGLFPKKKLYTAAKFVIINRLIIVAT